MSSLIRLDVSAVKAAVSDARCSAVGVQVGTFKVDSLTVSVGRLNVSAVASAGVFMSSEQRRETAAVDSRETFGCGACAVTGDLDLRGKAEGTEHRDITAVTSSESMNRDRAGSLGEQMGRDPTESPGPRRQEASERSGGLE